MSYPNRIYILAGQSWISGQVDGIDDLQAQYKNVWQLNSKIFNGTTFEACYSGTNNNQHPATAQANGCSIEMYFTDFATELGNDVYMLKYALGSTRLEQDAGRTDWNVNSTGEMYDGLVADIASVKTWMSDRGKSYVFKGILWWQGAGDSVVESASLDYLTNLNAWYSGVCTAIGYNVPIYQYNVETPPSGNRDYKDNVNSAKSTFTSSDTSLRKLFDCNVTSWQADNIHPTLAEYLRIWQDIQLPLIRQDL